MHVITHAPPWYAETVLGLFHHSLSKHSDLVCVFPHGICPNAKAPMQAISRVYAASTPFYTCSDFPFGHPGRLNATTVSALLPPYNQQSSCSVTPLWKQTFDIGSTIYRRVVIPNPASLEIEKSASKATFCKSF